MTFRDDISRFITIFTKFSVKMSSEAYLCELCSEIYRHEEELTAHMLEDHHGVFLPVAETEKKDVEPIIIEDNEKEETALSDLPGDVDLNAMMMVTDEIDFSPFTSTGDPIPSAEFCFNVPVVLDVLNQQPSAPPSPSVPPSPSPSPARQDNKKRTGRPRKPRAILTCEFCSYTTPIKSCMSSHRLTHTLDCPFCQFKTIIPERLTDHLQHKHFDNNNWEQTGPRARKVPALKRDYMKEDFIFVEEIIDSDTDESQVARQDIDEEQIGRERRDKVTDGDGLDGEFGYLRPGVIISPSDMVKVYDAYEFISKRGYVGQR